MDNIFKGKAWTFGDNINSETILLSGKEEDWEDAKKHVLEYHDPDFAKNVQEGDFIVAGKNFGASSGRPAGEILKGVGIKAILCESAGRVFYRNTWNMALPILQCAELRGKVNKGDSLEVNVEQGLITLPSGEVLQCEPTPWMLMDVYHAGGMLEYITSRRSEYKTLEQI